MSNQAPTPKRSGQLAVFDLPVKVSEDISPGANLFHILFGPLPGRPVESAIRQALVQRLEKSFGPPAPDWQAVHLKKGWNRIRMVFVPPDLTHEESVQLSKEIKELFGWVAPVSRKAWSEETRSLVVKVLVEAGDTCNEPLQIAEEMKLGHPGPPVKKRQRAIEAYQLKLKDGKKWTWNKLTKKLCDCGAAHTYKCQDNLRSEVGHLKRLLRKYQISLP